MKNAILILFFALSLSSISHAGGDDRDQQLPLNSINTEQNIDEDGAPRFLQEDDEVIQDDAIQQSQKEIEELIQTKLVNEQANNSSSEAIESDPKLNLTEKVEALFNQYIKSDQGILIMLILFVIALILIFNFVVRDK
jgi:hypothetical protein